ncbi:hypothetical protein Tco_0370737 [Tanacetum coccineum]
MVVTDCSAYGLAIPATMLNKEIMQSESYKRFIMYSTGQIPPKKKSRRDVIRAESLQIHTNESVDETINLFTETERSIQVKTVLPIHERIVSESVLELRIARESRETDLVLGAQMKELVEIQGIKRGKNAESEMKDAFKRPADIYHKGALLCNL